MRLDLTHLNAIVRTPTSSQEGQRLDRAGCPSARGQQREKTAVKIVTARRGVLRTSALTAITGALSLATTAIKPAAAGTLPELKEAGFHYASNIGPSAAYD